MPRGKYGEKAAKRQAELAATNDLASYQRRVAQLTAENRELHERLAAQDRAAKQAERRLRAERDEGVAPQVQVLTLQLREALAKCGKAERFAKDEREKLVALSSKVFDHLRGPDHKFGVEAAMEVVLSWAGQGSAPSMVVRGGGKPHSTRVTAADIEAQRRIDAARGIHHHPNAGRAREVAP